MPTVYSELDDLVPAGDYIVKIIKAYDKDRDGNILKDKKDNEVWNLVLEIQNYGDFYQRRIYDKILFSPGLKNRTTSIFRSFGFDLTQNIEVSTPEVLVGKCAVASIVHETYEGEIKVRPKFYGGYHLLAAEVSGLQAQNLDPIADEEVPF